MSKPEDVDRAPVHAVVMPCPRLEFRWIKEGESWYERECVYGLVLPLGKYDIRHTDPEDHPTEKVLEIGRTKVTGGNGQPPIYDGKVDTPFRDGAHAQWDCDALGGHIPIVAVCGDVATIVEKQPKRTSA